MKHLQWLEIDKKAIEHNYKSFKYLLRASKKVKIMAVVKANAYGHGLVEFAQEAVKNGAKYLGVVNIDEALILRKAKIETPILVLGYVPLERANEAAVNDIEIAVTNQEYAVGLIRAKLNKTIKVHLKVETGINRLGVDPEGVLLVAKELVRYKKIDIVGLYSHLASVEENNHEYTAGQFEKFGEIITALKKYNIDIPVKHIASSGATMLYPESFFDMVRVGISQYGLWPSEENKQAVEEELDIDAPSPFLKPVMSYKSCIVQLKEVKSGYIGYGCSYRVNRSMRVAVVPVGYYEGFDRKLSCSNPKDETCKCGEVLISGVRCPVVGRVCMNMIIVDVSKVRSSMIREGDEVVIFGKQGNNEITVDEIANKLGTINYEVVSRIPEHITRIYR